MRLKYVSKYLAIVMVMGAAALAGPTQAQTGDALKETPEGVVTPDGHVIGKAKLLRSYSVHQPAPASAAAESQRARNRATVKKYFELSFGEERARLFADDGVKQVLSRGFQWEGMESHLQNNRENVAQFPGWKWSNTTIWDTQDPTVFWVEADGATVPPPGKEAVSGHYVLQVVLKDGKIALYREFATTVKLAK